MSVVSAKIQEASTAYLTATLNHLLNNMEKADDPDYGRLFELLSALPESEREQYLEIIIASITTMASDGARRAIEQVISELSASATDVFSQANLDAIAWAESRSAELVTSIDKTTRDGIKDLVTKAETEGWSTQQLAQELRDEYGFSSYRAEMVARTETAMADVQGSLAGWKASGVVDRKQFLAAPNCCSICQTYNRKIVDLDASFPGGDPPVHPNCRCDVIAVLKEQEGAE